jgi:hypothetical protein
VDPDTLTGTCVGMCRGTEVTPVCERVCDVCLLAGVVDVCVPACDPLAPSCADGHGCVPARGDFACVPLVTSTGALGEPCALLNDCAEGLACLSTAYVPDCRGGVGCCGRYCDLSASDDCDADVPGTVCLGVSDEPPSSACVPGNVGVCALP